MERSKIFPAERQGMGKDSLVPSPVEDGGRSMSPGSQEAICNNHNKAGDGTRDLRQRLQKKVLKEPFFMHEFVALSYRARREIVAQMAPQYLEASLARKRMMLDSLVEMTGYARKYAIGLLQILSTCS